MNLHNYKDNKQLLVAKIIERLHDFNQRERIVINMPFGCNVNRLEIYCSETAPSGNNDFFGVKFRGIVSLQSFNDYTNKPYEKSSYSYENELITFIPRLIDNLFKVANY
jgi:hypothetical protein